MSDHDAFDPVDKAYAQAEAMLDDEAARAARRARVLGAVAGDAETASAPPKRRASWATGGWLAAASVAGVSVLVALQFTAPPVKQRPPSRVETPVAAVPAPAASPATAAAVETAPPAPPTIPRAPVSPPADFAVAPPSAFPAPTSKAAVPVAAPAPPPPPPTAPQAAADSVEGVVVTGQAVPPSMARAEAARAPTAQTSAAAPLVDRTERLHAAAAAGRLAELNSLLAQGIPVDSPDNDGETALMKAIQARSAAAAALLRRHGASLDRTNRAGVSARDMAVSIDDPALNRALGLEP